MPRGRKKLVKPARKAKTATKAKPQKRIDKAPAVAVRKRSESRINEEAKVLFLDHHLPKVARLRELANNAQANLRAAYKTAKKDGFLKIDFDIAYRLKTQTGEKDIIAEMARTMTVGKWLGHSRLGKQLDLFTDIDQEDAEAQAYDDGEEASRTGKPASPLHAPGTPGYNAYMRGFHDHQEELSQGFKKQLDEPEALVSGTRMTRSQFRAQQAAAKKQADAAEERSLFTKRAPSPDEAAE